MYGSFSRRFTAKKCIADTRSTSLRCVQIETLDSRWRIEADQILADVKPERMTRFDEGWWQLLGELAIDRSPAWIERLCQAMATWNAASVEEAEAVKAHRERGEPLTFDRHLELSTATIGMYATIYLLEDAHSFERSREFDANPTVKRLEKLANQIVGLGNDLLNLGKDCAEEQCNLVTTLMRERQVPIDAAIEMLVRMHDAALEEFDRLGDTLLEALGAASPYLTRWLQDLRYAALGFSLWESQSPRCTAHKIVVGGQVLEPKFSFSPPRNLAPPGTRRLDPPPSTRRLSVPPSSARFAMASVLDFPEDS